MRTIVFNANLSYKRWFLNLARHPTLLLKKLINYLLVISQAKMGSSKCIGVPIYLVLDPCNCCHLRCPLCPTGQRDSSRSKYTMRFDEFKRLMDELGDYVLLIYFFNWGEPLLNKDLFRMIKYANAKGIYTILSTNLSLPSRLVELLPGCGLDECIVSIDGTTQDIYEKYRNGGKLSLVLNNLSMLIRKKKNDPYIIWQYLVFRHNEHQVKDAIELAEKTGVDAMKIEGARANMGTEPIYDVKRNIEISKEYLLPFESVFSRYDEKGLKNTSDSCSWPWTTSVINPNGSVSPCCAVWPEKFDLGNCFKQNFKAIWNNEKYQMVRKIIPNSQKRVTVTKENKNLVCRICITQGSNIESLSFSTSIEMLVKFLFFILSRFKR